jgi:hypothetical protein
MSTCKTCNCCVMLVYPAGAGAENTWHLSRIVKFWSNSDIFGQSCADHTQSPNTNATMAMMAAMALASVIKLWSDICYGQWCFPYQVKRRMWASHQGKQALVLVEPLEPQRKPVFGRLQTFAQLGRAPTRPESKFVFQKSKPEHCRRREAPDWKLLNTVFKSKNLRSSRNKVNTSYKSLMTNWRKDAKGLPFCIPSSWKTLEWITAVTFP